MSPTIKTTRAISTLEGYRWFRLKCPTRGPTNRRPVTVEIVLASLHQNKKYIASCHARTHLLSHKTCTFFNANTSSHCIDILDTTADRSNCVLIVAVENKEVPNGFKPSKTTRPRQAMSRKKEQTSVLRLVFRIVS